MEDRTQEDGLPSVAALEVFDKADAAIADAMDKVFSLNWAAFDRRDGIEFGGARAKIWSGIGQLQSFRKRYKVETVTTTKVVRA